MEFSPDQLHALEMLAGPGNVFLTGKAGTGKSTVLRKHMATDRGEAAVLASTGAAAVLVGGRTFHSFFGLGILEGGRQKTVERALKNPRLKKRLKATDTVVIDEISMLSGETLATAEEIARLARGNEQPWGNLRVIAVGDFAQLPPVTPGRQSHDWAFLHEVWQRTGFQAVNLETVHRAPSQEWNKVLNRVREGICDQVVKDALNARLNKKETTDVTRLFGMRHEAENYNRSRLADLPGEPSIYTTEYSGDDAALEQIKRNSPIPEELVLKMDALVMIRRNDPDGFYVNGSLGHIRAMSEKFIRIELLDYGITVELEPVKFEQLNADGEVVAAARNFPLNLAYGTTIHKSQGATLDAVRMRLAGLWESGQAYVALSRVRSPERLYLDGWDPRSIRADQEVLRFHSGLGSLPLKELNL
jgi:ATP-dependent exoDNAse (exonuclease V) alpha subunit